MSESGQRTDRTPEYANCTIRPATTADVDALVSLRRAMFEAMGHDERMLAQATGPMREYFERHLPTGTFRAWLAEDRGKPIAGIGLVIHGIPPSPGNLVGKEAYLMNLVTLPAYRRRGIARNLMLHVLDVVRSEGICKVSLHASSEGRQLYEALGFLVMDDVPEMRLTL